MGQELPIEAAGVTPGGHPYKAKREFEITTKQLVWNVTHEIDPDHTVLIRERFDEDVSTDIGMLYLAIATMKLDERMKLLA